MTARPCDASRRRRDPCRGPRAGACGIARRGDARQASIPRLLRLRHRPHPAEAVALKLGNIGGGLGDELDPGEGLPHEPGGNVTSRCSGRRSTVPALRRGAGRLAAARAGPHRGRGARAGARRRGGGRPRVVAGRTKVASAGARRRSWAPTAMCARWRARPGSRSADGRSAADRARLRRRWPDLPPDDFRSPRGSCPRRRARRARRTCELAARVRTPSRIGDVCATDARRRPAFRREQTDLAARRRARAERVRTGAPLRLTSAGRLSIGEELVGVLALRRDGALPGRHVGAGLPAAATGPRSSGWPSDAASDDRPRVPRVSRSELARLDADESNVPRRAAGGTLVTADGRVVVRAPPNGSRHLLGANAAALAASASVTGTFAFGLRRAGLGRCATISTPCPGRSRWSRAHR